ncbi:MAG TPA: DUF4388 domain-containing protein, partial [Nannocystis exedens]|nr:DUF4388 domain-containing protein [Nannocystis exedens]
MAPSSPGSRPAQPGILYYDPNPTTAKLATAGLRLAGFQVFNAHILPEAVDLCREHGPGGDASVVALLLDASADPEASASVLKALVQIPGAAQLPGILLVSRSNPTPIPGAEDLPSLRRPFSTPALVKVVRETLDEHQPGIAGAPISVDLATSKLKQLLSDHFPDHDFTDDEVERFSGALKSDEDMPNPPTPAAIRGVLEASRLEAVLEMLGNAGVLGVLTVEHSDDEWGKLHLDQGRIRLGEYKGTVEDLKLGRFIVEGGFLRDEQLEAFLVGKDPERRPLGTRLVDAGLLSPADLAQVLVDQARAVTCQLLSWTEGTYTFAPARSLDPMASAASRGRTELLVSEALLDGLRRIQEAAVMGPHMPNIDDIFLRNDEQVARLSRDALPREELAVLELVNARNTVK